MNEKQGLGLRVLKELYNGGAVEPSRLPLEDDDDTATVGATQQGQETKETKGTTIEAGDPILKDRLTALLESVRDESPLPLIAQPSTIRNGEGKGPHSKRIDAPLDLKELQMNCSSIAFHIFHPPLPFILP